MTASATKPAEIVLHASAHDHRIAAYAAAAIAITIAEAALPSPLPGVKPGLANIIVLVVLLRHGWRDAVWVSLLRVIAASLVGAPCPGLRVASWPARGLCTVAAQGRPRTSGS